jgi:uncharacterized protein YegP (UPF0339 family)
VIEFQLHRAVNGQYYCRIVASNGEVLFTSETYPNKRDLVYAADVVPTRDRLSAPQCPDGARPRE